MADLRNKYGEVVYRIEGDRIIDIYGTWKYEFRDNYIFDTYGNRMFEIRGEWLHDTYGNRIGEMKDIADILPNPKDSSGSTSSDSTPIRKEKPSGCLGWLGFIIGGWFTLVFKSNWGGKIGLIVGAVLIILAFIFAGDGMPVGNYLISGIFFPLFVGTIGAVIGAIVIGIKKIANRKK